MMGRSAMQCVALSPNMTDEEVARFTARLPETRGDGCWLWTGPLRRGGYGAFSFRGNSRPASRIAVLWSGREIPHGHHVDHLCRTPQCVNPDHLEVVTPGVNSLRGKTFCAENAAKTHCVNGHEFNSENLSSYSPNGWRYCKACSRERMQKRRDDRRANR